VGEVFIVISVLVPLQFLFDNSIVNKSYEFLRSALDLVLPERCPCCGAITTSGGNFCGDCWQQLHFLTPPWCASCALPLAFAYGDDQICANCIGSPPLHDGIRAAVAYDDVSRQVVLRMKHGGKIGMGALIARHLARHLPQQVDNLLLVPVPLHWTRLWSRGFNQSALIAKSLAKTSNAVFCPDILVRQKRTPFLRGMTGKERGKMVSAAFAINPKWQGRIDGAKIILIDDVMTSGATSNACVKALKKGGAEWVQIFCWARVLRGEIGAEATLITQRA
jgi:ComF family protein